MRESGSSIVEVVVMMLIISVSIVGIYSMVSNGQKLAILSDNRLAAINIAKEGIESLGALRDTFKLRAYGASGCFFTIDGGNYSTCPQTSTHKTYYILNDTKTLTSPSSDDFSLCIDTHGWYYQGNSCIASMASLCGGEKTTDCRTIFTRKIYFEDCDSIHDQNQCIKGKVEVSWANTADKNRHTDADKTLLLEQEFTKN